MTDVTTLCAIDPGSVESAYVVIGCADRRPIAFAKVPNEHLLLCPALRIADRYAIEMVASYGMAVGVDVFQTVRWIGRFEQTLITRGVTPQLVYRRDIKLHHCGSVRAKDANIIQALIDRFAPGEPNRGKGTKAKPGWFYGFAADVWQAYALAVYLADFTPREGAT